MRGVVALSAKSHAAGMGEQSTPQIKITTLGGVVLHFFCQEFTNAKNPDNSFHVKVPAFVRLGRFSADSGARGFQEKSRRRIRERRGGFPCVWRPAMTSSCMELFR